MTGQLMTLRDLSVSLNRHNVQIAKKDTPPRIPSIYSDVACNVVDQIFRYIDTCLKENKSKYQVSLFAKSFIRGIMTDNVKGGINNFIQNMNDDDVKALLKDIQKELDKVKLEEK